LTDNPSVFSAATIFQTFGFLIGFIISLVSCTNIKLYIYFGLCALSLICYLALLGIQKFKMDSSNGNRQNDENNSITTETKTSKEESSTNSSEQSTPLKDLNSNDKKPDADFIYEEF
jgi:hypothetical protein